MDKLLLGVPSLGSFDIHLGGRKFSASLSRAKNYKIEPPLDWKHIEEVMTIFPIEDPEAHLKEDSHDFIQEGDDSRVTPELPSFEPAPWPPNDLKTLPPGLHYAFLNSNTGAPIIISDKLTDEETYHFRKA